MILPVLVSESAVIESYPDLVVDGTSITLCGNHFYNAVKVINGGTIYVQPYNGSSWTGWLNITANSILVDSASKIDGNARGYAGGGGGTQTTGSEHGNGTGRGYGGSGWPNGGYPQGGGGGGAGYGGNGGSGALHGGGGGLSYGSSSGLEVNIGSGGGGGGGGKNSGSNGGNGGKGGAAVVLNASAITIHGTIQMNGEDGGNGAEVAGYCGGGGGGGSGGGILIYGNSVNINYAHISAAGGHGGDGGYQQPNFAGGGGGGGGGGRIKIIYELYRIQNYSAVLDVSGGTGGSKSHEEAYWGGDGAKGTVFYEFIGVPPPVYLYPDLILNGSSEIPSERVAYLSGNHRFRNVVIVDGGILYVSPYNGSLFSGWLNITADSIFVDSASRIDAQGAGYVGGNGGSGAPSSSAGASGGSGGTGLGGGDSGGNGSPGQGSGGGGGGGGGGYGGAGGIGGSGGGGGGGGSGGSTYGDATLMTIQMGSGGGGGGGGGYGEEYSGGGGGAGGTGGGAIIIRALNINISGTIDASGGNDGSNGGNGAGIWDPHNWNAHPGYGGTGYGGGGGGGGGGFWANVYPGGGGGGGGGGSGGGIMIVGGHVGLSGNLLARGSEGGDGGTGAGEAQSHGPDGEKGGYGGGGRIKVFYVSLRNNSTEISVYGHQNGTVYYEKMPLFSLEASLSPSVDTYVDEWNPTESYGNSPDIFTSWDIAEYARQYAYLRFDVSVLGLVNLFKADFHMYEYGDNGGGSESTGIIEQAHFVSNDTWTGNITWNTRPSPEASLYSIYTPGASSGVGWHRWDVTTQTWSEMHGDGNLSLCIDTHNMNLTAGGLQIKYMSSESGINTPFLKITYGIRDISIVNVTAFPTEVMEGDVVNINVTIKNNGTFNESSTVTAFFDGVPIQTIEFHDLVPDESVSLLFRWDTWGTEPGKYYHISATVDSVLGETISGDNRYYDGYVRVGAIRIISIIPCDQFGNPKNNFTKGTVAYFNVALNSTASEPKSVLLTVNAIDSQSFTMSMSSLQGPISPGASSYILPVAIPLSAHTGEATAFANAFTDWTHNGGVSYCPERGTTFQVTEG